VYQSIDRAVGRFAAELPTDTMLVVFSLHGITSNHGDLPSMVLLPELLYRFSFRKQLMRGPDYREWKSNGYPVVTPSGRWDHHMRAYFPNIVPKLKNWLVRMLPESVIEGVRLMEARLNQPHHAHRPIWVATRETDCEPGDIGEPRASLSWAVPCWYGRYWSRMKVFALPSFDDALIRINLRGRERNGIINLDDYRSVCDEVESCITACRNPRTGRPVVEEVIRTPGNPLDPTRPVADIIVRWAGGVDAFKHAELGIIGPFPFKRTGGHTSHGFAFISGPGIERADLGEHSAIDLPPTILALLGHEPHFKLSGRPLLRASGY